MNKIIGVTVGTPVPQSDLGQNNPNRADYIKSKHLVANAIKGSASGNPIVLDDVSPLEHEVKVQTDVNGAEVKKYEGNLWKFEDMTEGKPSVCTSVSKIDNGVRATITEQRDGSYLLAYCKWLPISALEGKTLLISCDMSGTSGYPRLGIGYIEGAYGGSSKFAVTLDKSGSVYFTVDSKSAEAQGKDYIFFGFYSNASNGGSAVGKYVDYTNFKVQEPTTYTADENGNVSGIIANGENMTLVADSGITISAEYSVDTKKYIDKKFAELQALVLEV